MGDLHLASKIPLAEFLGTFCGHERAVKAHKTYKNDVSRLRVIFGPICEALKILPPGSPDSPRQGRPRPDRYAGLHIQADLLEDVTTEVINRWLSARVQQNGWVPKTVNNYRETLHKMFAYAIKHHGFVSRDRRHPNPVGGVDRQDEPAPDITFLKLDEIDEQLRVLEGHPVLRTIAATCIYAGLRRGEVVMLTPDDVDMANRLVRVRAKTVGGKRWQPKTKRNRVVPISDALYDILGKYQTPVVTEWFFPSPHGKQWDPDNLTHELTKINGRHGLPWCCGDFRHTFGSHLAQKGESLYKISTLMGNSPEICKRHYAALIPEKMADVVEFGKPETPDPKDDTKAMLRAILERLEAGEEKIAKPSILRLVRSGESA
jgi:integrase